MVREVVITLLAGRWFIVGGTVLGLLAGAGYASGREPVWSSTVVVENLSPESLAPTGLTLDTDPGIVTFGEAVDRVRGRLSSPESLHDVDVRYSPVAAHAVEITARASTRADARAAAQALAQEYVDVQVERLSEAVEGMQLSKDQLGGWLAQNQSDAQLPIGTAGAAEHGAAAGRYQESLRQIAQAEALPPAATIRSAASSARAETAPTSTVLTLGAAAGLVAGLAWALRGGGSAVVASSRRLRSAGETVLGTLSRVGPAERTASGGVLVAGRTTSPFTQSVRELRTVLASSLTGTDGAMLLVTAVGSRTGTASVTANLAASFALSGRRVIVMSGDLRRPGLVDLLLPEGRTRPDPLDSVPTRVPNLRVVLPLASPVDPADLLATDSVRERLDDLRASADLLVMDAPPVLVAPDAAILSGYADATVVLAQEGSTTVGQVIDVLDRLRQADGTPAGVVITSDHVRSDVRAEHTVVGDDGPTVRRAAAGDRPEPMTVPTPRP